MNFASEVIQTKLIYKETLSNGEAMINTFQETWQISTLIAEIVIYEFLGAMQIRVARKA
jgi:hypothetical protein